LDVTFRQLGLEEGGVLTEAARAAYGTGGAARQVRDPGVRVKADDIAVASDHGRELLDCVVVLERRS